MQQTLVILVMVFNCAVAMYVLVDNWQTIAKSGASLTGFVFWIVGPAVMVALNVWAMLVLGPAFFH